MGYNPAMKAGPPVPRDFGLRMKTSATGRPASIAAYGLNSISGTSFTGPSRPESCSGQPEASKRR